MPQDRTAKSNENTANSVQIPLRFTDTTLRDAHQSLWATRLKTDDILQIIDTIDNVGYYSLEMWGGATFDVCLRFLRENPWERLRQIKAKARKTPLQMLLRGQNILGYKNYPDDLLDRFIELSIYNGIDIFRVFDALNDTRNLEYSIKSIKRHGGHAQGTLSYTISPYHTIENYVKVAKEQVELGIDTLCIKDMAGILSPVMAQKLVSALVKEVNVPIQLHCHSTSGMAHTAYYEGVMAGAGAIDCAISPVAGSSSQPPIETMAAMFRETGYSVDLDFDAFKHIAKFFTDLTPKMSSGGNAGIIDPGILIHQIPGGMISNLRSQLAQQKALDRLEEVLDEVPRVREDLGFPPLVTPTSQIVGTQAVLNVLSGERYKIIPNEVKNYVKGLYGRSPMAIDPEFSKQILGGEKPITHRPADDLEPMLPSAIENLDTTLIEYEEDILSFCLFPEQSLEYFKWRALPADQRPPAPVDIEIAERLKAADAMRVEPPRQSIPATSLLADKPLFGPGDYQGVNTIMATMATLNITEISISRGETCVSLRSDAAHTHTSRTESAESTTPDNAECIPIHEEPRQTEPETPAVTGKTIDSPLVGTFYRSPAPGKPNFSKEGDTVNPGDTLCIVEAMKLINEIKAPLKGRIIRFLVMDGNNVDKNQPLVEVEEV